MSLKFEKDRSVSTGYFMVPMAYTGIRHPNDASKELVLMDYMHKHWIGAYRSNKTNRIGRTFVLKIGTKNGKKGFYYRGKLVTYSKSGWVL